MALEWSYVTLSKKSLRIAEELTFLTMTKGCH